MSKFTLRRNHPLTNDELNTLFSVAWPDHQARDFQAVLQQSLGYVSAWDRSELVGFANLAWDGGLHAFLLDPTVDPRCRRQGLGTTLVREAILIAQESGVEWLHVDFGPALEPFYRAAGFESTMAGLFRIPRL